MRHKNGAGAMISMQLALAFLIMPLTADDNGPPSAMRYSNDEFDHRNVFEIGPMRTTGTAQYKWFKTEQVQNDLLRFEGSRSFKLPEGIKVDCYLYRGFDSDGDEWWLAFEKNPSMESGNYRIFFSYNKNKDKPFEEWLVPNGSNRVTLANPPRLKALMKAKSFNSALFSSGEVANDNERFIVQLEWDAIKSDLKEMAGDDEIVNLVWFEHGDRIHFGLPNTPFNRLLATELKLPPLSLLNQYSQDYFNSKDLI